MLTHLIPQLLPLFSHHRELREAYGTSTPVRLKTLQRSNDDKEGCYWDLVHVLYSEMVETVGTLLMRELVTGWPSVERSLEVCHWLVQATL